jgi:2-(1,2-epoxy-1,2-dihydrophenyl)acetyl-CoA isomerase
MESTYPEAPFLRTAVADGVLTVTFDNPSRRNALDDEAVAALLGTLDQAQTDEAVRAVLITGGGSDFCSGFDIIGRNAGAGERPRVGQIQRRLPKQAHRLIPQLVELQLPVVAAVSGYAVGIGLQLVLACDFAVVGQGAQLWEPFAQRGMAPDSGAAWLLPRLVGPLRARQLLMLGRRLSGAEAAEWGIAHACVEDSSVDATARELAEQLASGPTVALGLTKWLISSGQEQPLKDHLSNEGFAMELASRSPDFREGLSAFAEKREPRFTGR